MSSLPATLSGLTDREAIIDCINRVATAFDRKDEALFRSGFDTNANMIYPLGSFDSLEAMVGQMFNPLMSIIETTHSLSAIRVEVAAGASTASATCSALAMHILRGKGLEPDHDFYQAGSLYDIDFVKAEGLWKIKKWVVRTVWGAGNRAAIFGQ